MKPVQLWFSALPLMAGIWAGLSYTQYLAPDSGWRPAIAAGVFVGLCAAGAVWTAQILALALLGIYAEKKLYMPREWLGRGRTLGLYLATRTPKYRAAVLASNPFMTERVPPKVPRELTWPLEPDSDHGLTRMMASLYREHRQDRYDMHLNVYREVMRLDVAAVATGRDHADVSALVQKLGYEKALAVVEADIPTELALSMV